MFDGSLPHVREMWSKHFSCYEYLNGRQVMCLRDQFPHFQVGPATGLTRLTDTPI